MIQQTKLIIGGGSYNTNKTDKSGTDTVLHTPKVWVVAGVCA